MAVVILVVLAIVWWIAWWGSKTFEVIGLAPRLARAIARRFRGPKDQGFFAELGRDTAGGFLTAVATWGGFCLPLVPIVLYAYLAR